MAWFKEWSGTVAGTAGHRPKVGRVLRTTVPGTFLNHAGNIRARRAEARSRDCNLAECCPARNSSPGARPAGVDAAGSPRRFQVGCRPATRRRYHKSHPAERMPPVGGWDGVSHVAGTHLIVGSGSCSDSPDRTSKIVSCRRIQHKSHSRSRRGSIQHCRLRQHARGV